MLLERSARPLDAGFAFGLGTINKRALPRRTLEVLTGETVSGKIPRWCRVTKTALPRRSGTTAPPRLSERATHPPLAPGRPDHLHPGSTGQDLRAPGGQAHPPLPGCARRRCCGRLSDITQTAANSRAWRPSRCERKLMTGTPLTSGNGPGLTTRENCVFVGGDERSRRRGGTEGVWSLPARPPAERVCSGNVSSGHFRALIGLALAWHY